MMNAQTEIRNSDAAYNQDQLMNFSRTTSADEIRWRAVLQRDRSSDGKFVFGVLTTGVYCRPSCPARRPLRKNVRFFTSPAEAQQNGLRACLRCKPLNGSSANARLVERLCRYMEANSDQKITLEAVSKIAVISR